MQETEKLKNSGAEGSPAAYRQPSCYAWLLCDLNWIQGVYISSLAWAYSRICPFYFVRTPPFHPRLGPDDINLSQMHKS